MKTHIQSQSNVQFWKFFPRILRILFFFEGMVEVPDSIPNIQSIMIRYDESKQNFVFKLKYSYNYRIHGRMVGLDPLVYPAVSLTDIYIMFTTRLRKPRPHPSNVRKKAMCVCGCQEGNEIGSDEIKTLNVHWSQETLLNLHHIVRSGR